jgi:hypothetical protein
MPSQSRLSGSPHNKSDAGSARQSCPGLRVIELAWRNICGGVSEQPSVHPKIGTVAPARFEIGRKFALLKL